jgi:hypothetical protein
VSNARQFDLASCVIEGAVMSNLIGHLLTRSPCSLSLRHCKTSNAAGAAMRRIDLMGKYSATGFLDYTARGSLDPVFVVSAALD